MSFIDGVGFDPIDAGPLAGGWRFERAQPADCRRFDRAGLIAALTEAGTATQAGGSWRT